MKAKVLIVDDMEINRDILEEILEEDYEVLKAADGIEALKIIDEKKTELAIVLLDLMMPNLDGFGVLEEVKKRNLINKIPIIAITGDTTVGNEKRCFDYGVSDFVKKPFDEMLVKLRVGNVVNLYTYKNNLEDKVETQTKTLRSQYLQLKEQALKLEKSNQKIIDILGTVVESRNLESGQHINRVKSYTGILAKQMMEDYPEYGLTQHIIDVMIQASALHDVGKIAIPDSILLKPGRLTADEFEVMKSHTTRGCIIINNIQGAWDEEYAKMSYEICRHHHEKHDGKGYPDGLAGDDIPVSAQIVSVADVYDALVNDRVYKDAIPKDKAFSMIVGGECGQFSPKLMECFRKVRPQFEALVTSNK